MRLRSVTFEPFGALRGVTLDFAAPRALHVVVGPNEAGKSTALRGIVDFFFGIPRDSADQHERGLELRIRSRLVVDDGREIELTRRKGTKDPLRDGATDAAVPERELTRWLGGVDRATFLQLHALDHVRLREGGDGILRGEGRLGELMLEATTGATGLVDRLQSLRTEADALYRPRAKSTELQVAVEAWKTAERAMKHQSLSHVAWEEQQRGIAATRRRVTEAEDKLKDARADLNRLEQLVLLEDPVAKLRNRRARRAQLGDVADVPEGTAARRDELALEVAAATREAEQAEAQLPRLALEREAAARRADGVGAGFDHARAATLRASIEVLTRSGRDAANEVADIARARDEALETLGPPPDGSPWATRVVDARTRARAEACAAELRAARAALIAAEQAHDEAAARLASKAAMQPAAESDGKTDVAQLATAIAAAQRASAAGSALDGLAARELDLVQRLAPHLAATGVADVDALAALAVPDPSAVDQELRRRAAAASAVAAIERDLRGASERAARAAAELASLREGTAVPSEAELGEARRTRDEAMDAAFRALEGDDAGEARDALRTAERKQRDADAIADRLRHEASRVEHAVALEVERTGAERAARGLADRVRDAKAEEKALAESFHAAWPALEGVPLESARTWLARRADALAAAAELAAVRARVGELRDELASGASHLVRLGLAASEHGSKLALDAAIADAENRLEHLRSEARRREEGEAALLRAKSEHEAAVRARASARSCDEQAPRAWQDVVAPLRLGAVSTGSGGGLDEAMSTLVVLASATRETLRHHRGAARVAALEEELAKTRSEWSAMTAAAGLLDVAAEEVMSRAEEAREARLELPRIDEVVTQRRDVGQAARARAERAAGRLAELARQAGVPDDQLLVAEDRARDARALDREIARLEANVVERTGAATLEEAEAKLREVDFAQASESAEQLRADIETLEASRTRDLHDLGAQTASLDDMERGSRAAADLEETAQSHLTRARMLARRAAVARTAVALLEREIERHRAEREGPVLSRASALFSLLTAKRWEGLRVGESDAGGPEIRCVRGDRELGVAELSEGTRDQLYLALRLAAIEHHARTGAALPLVLDDVLVHFDDERTAAALMALGDVARTVQVLLFTHEERVAEIAARVLAPDAVALHELHRSP